ncbi:hypothetical protein ACFV2V_29055 [Streptomyces sp. NPDC059698]|uniref:hypothetical protein n=1 Tax=unclassified Streptomyces TaxID=2593676 RepID=UPI001160F695|nr:hypothetical protein [Streptomyces sp. CB02366]
MAGTWGWAHVQGERVQFSKRTYATAVQAREALKAHLDGRSGEDDCRDAAGRLRALPPRPDDVSVHVSGRSWYVQPAHQAVRVFAGDTVHTFRRPVAAEPDEPRPPKPRGKWRAAAADAGPGQLRVRVLGFVVGVLGGVSVLVSGGASAGSRVLGLVFVAVGVALMFNRAIRAKLGGPGS